MLNYIFQNFKSSIGMDGYEERITAYLRVPFYVSKVALTRNKTLLVIPRKPQPVFDFEKKNKQTYLCIESTCE